MVRLEDARLIELFEEALSEWNCDGFIVWKKVPEEWLEKEIEGYNTKSIGKLMYEYFQDGGKIDQVKETRHEYTGLYEFHFDFRFPIDGRKIYIETVLDETRTGPTITVVSMHDE